GGFAGGSAGILEGGVIGCFLHLDQRCASGRGVVAGVVRVLSADLPQLQGSGVDADGTAAAAERDDLGIGVPAERVDLPDRCVVNGARVFAPVGQGGVVLHRFGLSCSVIRGS